MFKTATITKQGQISIPSGFRKKFGLNKSKKVHVSFKDDKMIIEPAVDLLDQFGVLSAKRLTGKSIEEIMSIEKRAMERGFARKFKVRK